MKKLVLSLAIVLLALPALSACTADAQAKFIQVTCKADQDIPGLVQAGGTVATTVNPSTAPGVALAEAIDQIAHPVAVKACQDLGQGLTPSAVAVN